MKRMYTRVVYRITQNEKNKRIIADYAVTINREDIWTDIELYGGILRKNGKGYVLLVNPDMTICYFWNKRGIILPRLNKINI